MNTEKKYWLFKTEPGTFGWDHLKLLKNKKTHWEGVRNYQARNNMQAMKKGELGFFYHSVVRPPLIMGIVQVVKEFYPDFFAFDKDSKYYDIRSTPENPRWFMVDVKLYREFSHPITREELKSHSALANMTLLKRGTRLSVMNVTPKEFKFICKLRDVEI